MMRVVERVVVTAIGSICLLGPATAADLTCVEIQDLISGSSVYLELTASIMRLAGCTTQISVNGPTEVGCRRRRAGSCGVSESLSRAGAAPQRSQNRSNLTLSRHNRKCGSCRYCYHSDSAPTMVLACGTSAYASRSVSGTVAQLRLFPTQSTSFCRFPRAISGCKSGNSSPDFWLPQQRPAILSLSQWLQIGSKML
jgi:hypothetical protein